MRKIIAVCLFIFTVVYLQAETLSWDIRFLRGRARESVPISQIIRMETGEEFSISITPASDCFAYILSYDSSRQIFVIHDGSTRGGQEIFFEFILQEPSGTETLFVIMSRTRETELERLIQSNKSNPGSRQHSNNLYREISRLQNAASSLGEPPSVFIPTGGTTRSSAQQYSTRFTDKNLYVRPITIRH